MDVVIPSICFSSLAGAFLFYAGGRLGGRPPALPPPVDPSLEAPALTAERAARSRAEQEAAGALKAQREAVTALAEERTRSTALRQELAAERDARGRADAEAASERRRLIEEAGRLRAGGSFAGEAQVRAEARATSTAAELDRTRAELQRAESELAGARGGLEIARRELVEARAEATAARAAATQTRAELERATSAARRLSGEVAALRARAADDQRSATELGEARAAAEQRGVEAAALRADNARLEREIAALARERAAAPDLAEVQRRTVSATMALRSLEQRSEEVARREAENTDLRRRVEVLSAVAAEADALRRQVRDLEAQGFARRAARTLASEDAAPGGLAPELETSLTAGLRALCQAEVGCRAAVLSDMRGLLVAAHGEVDHRLELAAAAALTTTTAERLRDLLPVGEPAGFTLVDENATIFRTRWLRWEGECFLVSTLGALRTPADGPAEELRDRLAELIGR